MEQQKSAFLQQWDSCRLDHCGSVYILTLTGEGQHLFNASVANDILTALTVVEQSPDAGALITTNEGSYFSNGLDLKWFLNKQSIPLLPLFRKRFEGLLICLMKLGIPTIAAVCGHVCGAGIMFALAHDYRFTTERAVIYMAELDYGMMLPSGLMSLIRIKLSPVPLREVVFVGVSYHKMSYGIKLLL